MNKHEWWCFSLCSGDLTALGNINSLHGLLGAAPLLLPQGPSLSVPLTQNPTALNPLTCLQVNTHLSYGQVVSLHRINSVFKGVNLKNVSVGFDYKAINNLLRSCVSKWILFKEPTLQPSKRGLCKRFTTFNYKLLLTITVRFRCPAESRDPVIVQNLLVIL